MVGSRAAERLFGRGGDDCLNGKGGPDLPQWRPGRRRPQGWSRHRPPQVRQGPRRRLREPRRPGRRKLREGSREAEIAAGAARGPSYTCSPDGALRSHSDLGRAGAQPQGHRPRAAAQRDDRDDRPLGVGQVEPRLRHDLRRGAAALRRVALRLRAPVPGADGEARRGLDRGAVPGDLDRPEDHLAQPALDGRDRDRDLRLPAPALGADRQAPLPRVRGADRGPVGRADHRPGDDARPRARASSSPRRSCAAARANTRSSSSSSASRATAGSASTARSAGWTRREDQARQEVQARHLGRRRPPGDEGGPAPPPLRVDRGRDRARRRDRRGRRGQAGGRGRGRRGRCPPAPSPRASSPATSPSGSPSPSASPASTAAPRSPSWSRGSSPSTRRTAPAIAATASASSASSTPSWSCPTRRCPSQRARCSLGAPGHSRYWKRLIEAVADFRGDRYRRALAGPERGRARGLPLRHRLRAPQGQLHEPLRPPPLLQRALRGDRQQPRAPLRRD